MTAELAMGLPSLVALVFMLLWVLGAVAAQTRCAEAARLGARAAARGEAAGAIRSWVLRAAPPDALVEITRVGDTVRVRVAATVGGGEVGRLVPGVDVEAVALAAVEADPTSDGHPDLGQPPDSGQLGAGG